MIFTKQQYLTIYIFEFHINRYLTNEICLSKLPIFTSTPCSYPYLPVLVSLLPVSYPYSFPWYSYPTRTCQFHTHTQVRVRVPDPRVAVLQSEDTLSLACKSKFHPNSLVTLRFYIMIYCFRWCHVVIFVRSIIESFVRF